MPYTELIAYGLAFLVGITLGLIGSGGSILTIPILVYIVSIPPIDAAVYSFFIIGVAALFGVIKSSGDGMLNKKVALYFGVPGIISILIMRRLILPALPNSFGTIAGYDISKNFVVMVVFAILMIFSSLKMIISSRENPVITTRFQPIQLVLLGFIVGLVTGFVGVGGGFLIVPALVLFAGLGMKQAVATSMAIIAFNSLIGFAGSLNGQQLRWPFLIMFTSLAIAGTFAGIYFSKRISSQKLKPIFGWFVLIAGIYIILKETIFKI